ncbi:hypothetical protein [Bradyrhizobium sp. sBnM-33]|uniref:hypothetical protein n=1 Tax=Bradyrhizobium sp. sBnM-33 TaxID=2831780 RepID=UPI001BCBF411|nr:hypothetical protein [Bradyrhizobium sp. sBnM-33]WOH53831.1 hypothetical protein RX328_18105 [Bradyrhizobium sp. sBnM-33]
MLTQGPECPAGEVVAIVYKDSSGGLYVEPLPPQSLDCVRPVGVVGCPVARVWYGWANITPQQQADAEWRYASPDLGLNRVLVVGHLATVTVRDHLTGHDPIEQTWFMVNKLYLTPFRGRVYERHSTQFFYTTGTMRNAQVLAISSGEHLPRAARITWTGLATYGGSSGPRSVEDMFVTGEADFTRSPLPIKADEYFVRQTRPKPPPPANV